MSKQFSENEIGAAYDAAPQLIQDALSSDEIVGFGLKLQSTYRLHTDTAGAVADLIRNLLIGLINPAEFYEELQGLGIEQAIVQQLVKDLNEKIFIPLRKQMQEESAASPEAKSLTNIVVESDPISAVSAPLAAPVPPIQPIPSPAPIPTPARVITPDPLTVSPQMPTPPPLPPKASVPISPTPPAPKSPAPVAPPSFAPVAQVATPKPERPASAAPGELPAMRTMSRDMQEIQAQPHENLASMRTTHAESAPIPSPTSMVRPVSVERPASTASPAPVLQRKPTTPESVIPPAPIAQSAPTPIRRTAPETTVRRPIPPPPQAPPVAPSENREALHNSLKEYGVDPYREPPD